MLILWCGADSKTLKTVIGPAMGAAGVEHKVVSDLTKLPDCHPGDVVLAFGSKALGVLQNLKLVPKGRTVTSMREKELRWEGASILCTFDPGICSRDYARLPEIQWDVQLAARLVKTGSTKPPLGTYRWVESLHEIIEEIEAEFAKTGKPVDVASDTETLGLVEYNPDAWIISMSFTNKEGRSDAIYFEKGETLTPPPPGMDMDDMTYWEGLWTQVNWLLTSEKVSLRGANWKYDSRWIKHKWGISCTNFKFDTLLVGSLLDENRSNSLKLHAKIMTPMGGYEEDMGKYDMGRLDLVPKMELLPYMGGDTDATYRVAKVMKRELLADKRLCNFYIKLTHPASQVFEKVERTGILVDLPYYQNLQSELTAEINRLTGSMLDCLPSKLRIKYKDSIADALDEGKNPFRKALMSEFLFTSAGLNLKPQMYTEKTKEPSTSLDHLMMFEDDPVAAKFIGLMREHGSASKTLSTYVTGFLKHLRPDGRFHPTYLLSRMDYNGEDGGAVTGRCLTAEARILTDKGEIPIKELVERGEQGEAFKVLTHKNRWLPVTGFWRNGLKPVCTVKAQGRSLTSTYNHPYMSFPSWTLAEDLQLGSWLYSVVQPPKVEEWRLIHGWPFEVSNMGRVRRAIDGQGVKAGDIYKQQARGKWGHLKVTLRTFGEGAKKQDFPVHKLVADAFLTNKGGVEIAHLNGDAACNWSTNLKWVSVEDNKLHFRLHGNAQHDNQKKLDWETVDALRAGAWGNNHQAAEALGLSRELVRDVRLFKRWNGRRDSMAGFMPIRVDSVQDAGVQETFDLTVDEDHSFVANGLVVHNTSAKAPAVQCCVGETEVVTNVGVRRIDWLVANNGAGLKVLTHTGKFRDIVGVYDNGVQPVYDVLLTSGHRVRCTGNHPILTSAGWVRTDELTPGATCYVTRSPYQEIHQSHLLQLDGHEEPLLQRDQQGLASIRGSRDHSLPSLAGVPQFPCGHGGEAGAGVVNRAGGRERQLRAGELPLGEPEDSGQQPYQHQSADAEWQDAEHGRLGCGGRNQSGSAQVQAGCDRHGFGNSLDEGHPAELRVFEESVVVSVTPAGDFQTFDLTIDGSHSFVANGIAVHNTIPKHTKWTKKLRRAFVPPKGYTILQLDYSQGELRIAAVVANEPTMIKAYRDGLDLHAITAAQLNGYEMSEFLALPEDIRDELRSGGKAGNFGLLYGMQAPGFKEYAYTSYGVFMTDQEAVQKRGAFFDLYGRLLEWHDESKQFAKRWGHVRSPLGRVRHLPLINSSDRETRSQSERQAINSPIQSCLSDMMQLAMVHIDREYGHCDIHPFLMTHDSLALYVPEDDALEWAKRLKLIMENLPLERDFQWDSPLKFVADAEMSVADDLGVVSFATLKKLKGL